MSLKKLHICCSIDDNYAQHCGVMLCSLFENNKLSKFDVHILITSLNEDSKFKLKKLVENYNSTCQFHIVDADVLDGVRFRENRPLTEAAYYRILLSSTLDSSISKVLYLDSDIIVLGDITPLFELELDGYALAATKDLVELSDEYRFQLSLQYFDEYFCSGLMVLNLGYWRENNSEEELIKFSKKERKVFAHDQDALNAVFKDNWFRISPQWNRFYPYFYGSHFFENRIDKLDFEENPRIIHFVDRFKPWNRIHWIGIRWKKYRGYYYKYLSLTPWAGFKSEKLRLKKYQKYGLYLFLFQYSYKSILYMIFNSLINRSLDIVGKIALFPILLTLKIYYKMRS